MKEIAVVGAGICGSLLAYHLVRMGFNVSVFERSQHQDSCSYAAAGMLSPMAELESSEPEIFELGMRSLSLWPEILSRLSHDLNQSFYYSDRGTLVVYHHQDQREFEQYHRILNRKLINESNKGFTEVEPKSLEPELGHFHTGLFLENEAQLNAEEVLLGLKKWLRFRTQWKNHTVEMVAPHQVDQERFDWVFDCRGLAAKNPENKLFGVRGERLLIHAPEVKLSRMVRLMHPRYRIYIAPRPDHKYVIGATEIESDDDGPMSVRSTLELLTAAYAVHSGFAEGRILEMKTHVRPTRLNHMPWVKHAQGLTELNGLYRHGFLISPAIIDLALEELYVYISSRESELTLNAEKHREEVYEHSF